jgi:hypothetical protein
LVVSALITVSIHLLVAVATVFDTAAFWSGDSSGIQYMGIVIGWFPTGVAALIALVAKLTGRLLHPRLTLIVVLTSFIWPVMPILVASFGDYRWQDPTGRALSALAAAAQLGVMVWQARDWRLRRFRPSAAASL